MKPTKQHIADKALHLFNTKGFVNVRLQHIADSAFVSVGHLAYHFKNKEDIVISLYKRLKKKQELLLKEFRILPLFEDIELLLHNVYQLQQQYSFFYLDTLEILRAYPSIAEKHRELLSFQRSQIKFMVEFNVSRGAFIQPADQNQPGILSNLFCMTMDNWLSYQFINNNIADEQSFLNELWAILYGLFSDMGKVEFKQVRNKKIEYF